MQSMKMVEDFDTPDIPPYECASQLLSDIETANGALLSDLINLSYVRLALMLCPGVKTVVPCKEEVFYCVEPSAAFQISVSAAGNRDAYDMLIEICRANVWTGNPIPQAMRAQCSLILAGRHKPPPRRGPKPGQSFGLFFVSYLVGKYLSNAYNIPKVRGDGFGEYSAADIVSEALSDRGVEVSSTRIRDYLTHNKHKLHREKSDWIREMMDESYLAELGLISEPRHFSVSPFGLFMPMGRMT